MHDDPIDGEVIMNENMAEQVQNYVTDESDVNTQDVSSDVSSEDVSSNNDDSSQDSQKYDNDDDINYINNLENMLEDDMRQIKQEL